MQEGLVSVVVPIYKTEKFLNQCVESIVNQTYKNLEILLVDDGSPDNCPQMCDEWARRDRRIKVIHKENGGLGMARNTGIEFAQGEYICFFDSDDFVDLNTIKLAYEACKKEQADIALFGFVTTDRNGNPIEKIVPQPVKNVYSGKEVQDSFLPDLIGTDPKTGKKTNLHMSVWTCMISMEMILRVHWRFVSERDIISEDVYSLLGLYQHLNRVVILEEALYYYRENRGSVTRVYRKDRFEKVKFFYEKCLQLCQKCGYGLKTEHRCTEPFVAFVIALMKQEVAYFSNQKEGVRRIRQILSDDLLQKVLQQKKNEKMGIRRKVLFWSMRHKQYMLCYTLLKVKNKIEGR